VQQTAAGGGSSGNLLGHRFTAAKEETKAILRNTMLSNVSSVKVLVRLPVRRSGLSCRVAFRSGRVLHGVCLFRYEEALTLKKINIVQLVAAIIHILVDIVASYFQIDAVIAPAWQ
jgi:hypothetical protein